MNKTLSKVISVILSIAMIFSVNITGLQTAFAIGTHEEVVTAEDSSQDYGSVTLESLVDEEGYLTDEGLLSLKELPYDGEKYTDVIDNGDGTYSLRYYVEPIKYQNQEGEYEYIDTTLAETSPGSGSYETVGSDVNVQMSDNLNQSDAIQITYEGYKIAFQPLDIQTTQGESSAGVNFVEAGTEETEETIDAVEGCESVVYSDTFEEDTDIIITPTTSGVKEDIVLYEIPTVSQYSYQFSVKGVVPVLRKDGNLYFVDLEKSMIVAAIPIPVMYDSTPESGAVDIPVTLKKTGENTYEYTLYPDVEFLKTAKYPVVIDPSVSTQTGGIYDTYVKSTTSSNYCNDSNLRLGRDSSSNKYRVLVQLNSTGLSYIQSYLSGNTITQVKYWAYENYSGASSPTVQLYPITESWTSNTVNWANQPDFSTALLTSQMVTTVGWYSWDITSIGKDWANETTSNYGVRTYGILLKNDNETLNMYKRFNSDQATSNKDYFEYTYYDSIAPTAPSVSTSPSASSSWTNQTATPTVYWSGITDSGCSGLSYVQYKVDNGTWTYAGTGSSGSKQINVGSSGAHTIYIRGVDGANNYGAVGSIGYHLDMSFSSTPAQPTVSVTNGALNSGDSAQITATFSAVSDNLSGTSYYQILENGTVLSGYDHITSINASGYIFTRNDYATYSYTIRAYDNAGNYATSAPTSVTTEDRTGPTLEATDVTISPSSWTSGNPTIAWGTIDDLGGGLDNTSSGTGTSVLKYQVGGSAGTWIEFGDYEDGQAAINTSGWEDGEYQIFIAAFDEEGNISNTDIYLAYYKDATAPVAQFASTIDESVIPGQGNTQYQIGATVSDDNLSSWTLDWALGTNPLDSAFSGNIIAQDLTGTGLESTDYQTWNVAGLEEGRYYTLRLTAEDEAGNITVVKVKVLYALDTEGQEATLTLEIIDVSTQEVINRNSEISTTSVGTSITPDPGIEPVTYELYVNDTLVDAGASEDDLTFNPLDYDNGWVYPEGSQVFIRVNGIDGNGDYYYSYGTYQGHEIVDVFDDESDITGEQTNLSAINNIVLDDTNDYVELSQTGGVYSTDGYIISSEQAINGLITCVTLTVDQDIPANTGITYYLVYDGGEYEIQPNQSTELNIPTNHAYLKAVFTSDGSDTSTISAWNLDIDYIAFGDSIVINNSFEDNARGFQNLNGTVQSNGGIELYYIDSIYEYTTSGTVESTLRTTPGDVWEVFLSVEENIENNTDITYELSTDGGTTWQTITPGNDPNNEEWISVLSKGNQIVVRATLTSDGTYTPSLDNWSLQCRQTLTGSAYDIQLIDPVDNLSTLVDANYMTLLRWEPSETEGVTYKIYRSDTPWFTPSSTTYLDSTDDNYYYDYNLVYDTTFYYKVTAVKSFDVSETESYERESIPSNEAWAHTVSEDEMNEMLGLESYWSYSGFQTGGGTGYVNIANGNLVYQTTDLIVSDPFLAAAMTRTYNSMAGTKTPMGYGWDFSFNTCLLKECDENGDLQALILKDGDGSFHRFEYDDTTGSFLDAKGTFMELTPVYDGNLDVIGYEIKRKDDITYYFDAETMKLKYFTDNNGYTLALRYDYDIDDGNDGLPDANDRGNLVEIETSAGEVITITYYVDGSTPGQGDYTYINGNVDMVATITWTEDTANDPESITYTYAYNEDDQLQAVYATISGETICVQQFNYDMDLDDNSATTEYNVVILDAEDRITIVSTNDDQVTRVYDPIQVTAGDTDPILLNYVEDYYDFITYDWDENGESDTTVIRSNHNVNFQYDYDENGLVTMKTDWEFGYCFYYNHNSNYQVTSVTYPNTYYGVSSSVILTYSYDSNGNIEQIKAYRMNEDGSGYAALGTQTDYTYDANHPNKVATVTVKENASDSIVTSYTYDTNGNILTMTVADGSVDADNDPMEKTTTYSYYGINDPDGLRWQLKSVEDEFGSETRYIYDSKGRVTDVKVYDADGAYVRTTAHYTYDGFSRTDTVSQPYVTSATAVTDLQYDDYGRLIRKVNADGTAEQWDYDMTGWLTTYAVGTYSNGSFTAENSTSYEYDLLGRLVSTTVENDPTTTDDDTTTTVSYGYWDSTGWSGDHAEKVTTTDAEGVQTIEYYDTLGRLVKIQIYDGSTYITTSEYTYDTIGNVIKAVDNAGTVTEVSYDEMNRQVETIVDPFDSTDGKDNLNVETHYTYDYIGNVTAVTQVVYESESNQANPEEITTEYTYDDLSRLVMVREENPDYGQAGEPQYVETNYSYDKEETVNGEDLIMNFTEDALGYVSETYFNELGQTVMSLNRGDTSDGDDASGEYQETTYSYTDTNNDGSEALGLVDTVTRTDGTKEVYEYDAMGRVLRVDYYEANASTSTEYIVYTYNDLGQVLTETRTSNGTTHATSYRYDRMGRTSSVWEGTYVNGEKSVVAGGLDVEYTYNDVGQVTCINYNTGNATEHDLVYVYDGYGRISEIRLDPVEDDPETTEDETDNNIVRQYFYDATTGVLDYTRDYREFATVTAVLGDYIQTDYDYNSAGLVEQITYSDMDFADTSNTQGVTEQYTMEYDGRGQIVSEQLDTDYSVTEDTTTIYKAYDYDSLGRLVTAVSGDDDAGTTWANWDNETTYTYDLDGNRETMDNGTDVYAYTYNQFNQLTTVTKNSSAYENYTYDLRGNQTADIQAYLTVTVNDVTTTYNLTTTYDYDLSNQMTEASISTPAADEETGEVTYSVTDSNTNVYNEAGQRMSKTEEGEEERYFYVGSAILYTKNESGDLLTENILDLSGQIIASKRFDDDDDPSTTYELADQYFFYHYDVRGSVTAIVRPDGSLIEGYTYDEFGNLSWTEYDSNGDPVQAVNEIFDNEVTYTGSITDTSTGLQYMGSRYYDSSTGRFLTQDTYTGSPYVPWTQHLYSYCGNNPTNMIDPTGHVPSYNTVMSDGGNTRERPPIYFYNIAEDGKGNALVPPPPVVKADRETLDAVNEYLESIGMDPLESDTYIEITVINRPSDEWLDVYEWGSAGLNGKPGAFLQFLNILGEIIEGKRNWDPFSYTETGDVVIYVGDFGFDSSRTSQPYYDYSPNSYGCYFVFRDGELLFYQSNWKSDTVWVADYN